MISVTPGFFQTIGLPVLLGRDFTPADSEDAEGVAILNQSAATSAWNGQNPLGRRLEIVDTRSKQHQPEATRSVRVVGVVADSETRSTAPGDRRLAFVPLEQRYADRLAVFVRGTPATGTAVETLKDAVRTGAPRVALYDVRTLAEEVGGTFVLLRILALALSALGVLGVILSAVGIYGVTAYMVSQRTREFGIMRALGARDGHIYGLAIREGGRMMVLGLVPGLLLAQLFVLGLRQFVPGLQTFDWITFTLVPLALSVVALIACVLPVRRALRMQAYSALRAL